MYACLVDTGSGQMSKVQAGNEGDQPVEPEGDECMDDFWQTSLGKFRFTIDQLPQYLQYIYQLLNVRLSNYVSILLLHFFHLQIYMCLFLGIM